ncbi:beta-tubulin folding cofactor D [Ordospora colligata]|uniref:Beta-tubulin folding cofactor D n=1 Tax=Ordospora colligata OC4 TaxID=1354746 RepID=A0A0B2UKJ0_9MICR|nr:beta-tubulin folding cofactor D [Ordospora colligata OC4]KHN69525.1 beta-tubulin folding cofactor D [Ordospora colligata OC4]TBU15445.1 beta-tubulin folding cofactor D [Ordospora colligata]TBU18541.1 beta-tubulin folding cofactor D [Ordospora colligata]
MCPSEQMEEISSILRGINVTIMHEEYEKIISQLPTDTKYLKMVFDNIDELFACSMNGGICWLLGLLRNPFMLEISQDVFEKVANVLLKAADTMNIRKIALKCLAMLVYKTNTNHYIDSNDSECIINMIKVSKETYYVFLKYLSVLGKKVETNGILKDDSVSVKMSKIKIMASNPCVETLKVFFDLLNESDTRLGWVLCKSFVKICMHADMSMAISELKSRCKVIFANESSWINIMTILGMLALHGEDIGDVLDIVIEAGMYNNQFVHNAEMMREASLFLVWATVRGSSTFDKQLVCFSAARALLDESLSCRRAAASVVLEYVGKFPALIDQEIVSLINFHSVKRLSSCSNVVGKVMELLQSQDIFERCILRNIFHSSIEVKEQACYCISSFFDAKNAVCSIIRTNITTPSDYIGVFVLVREFFKQDRDDEVNEIVELICNIRVDSNFAKFKEFEVFVSLYVEIIEHVSGIICINDIGDTESIFENVYMFLVKNVYSIGVSRIAWMLMKSNKRFADRIFRAINRCNEGFILANARNEIHMDKVEKQYQEWLRHGSIDTKIHVMKAICFTEYFEKYEEHVLNGLEDYTTDFRGDIGAGLRMQSLVVAFMAMKNDIPTRYFVRYFVGKSKVLRDMCVAMCKECRIFVSGFEYIRQKSVYISCAEASIYNSLSAIRPFLDEFYKVFTNLLIESDKGNDEMIYMSLISALSYLDGSHHKEFVYGIIEAFGSVDASMCKMILEHAFEIREKLLPCITQILRDNTHFKCDGSDSITHNVQNNILRRIKWATVEMVVGLIQLEITYNNPIYINNYELISMVSLTTTDPFIPLGLNNAITQVLQIHK